MLVHKATMGVLDQFWTGRHRKVTDGGEEPVMAEHTLENTPLDPAEWWEVPRGSALGRKLRRYYPFCSPVVSQDGSLDGVNVWPRWKREGQSAPPAPSGRERRSRQRRRRAGVIDIE